MDILAMGWASQNASTFIIAHVTPCQDALPGCSTCSFSSMSALLCLQDESM